MTITKQFGDAAKTQYAAGDVARSNVVRSEVEIARAQQDVTVAEKQRADSYSTLRSLLLVPETTPISLSDKLAFVAAKYQLADLEALALKQRPDLNAEKLTRAAREASVHGAKVQSQPDAFIEYRQVSFDPSAGTSLRAGLTWPLMDLGSIRADVADKKAALAEQDAKLAETERRALLEVETALHALDQARQVVESFESGRIARVKELLGMVQTGYDKGASSYLDVLDAQRAYRNEQADYARALADYNIALATLQRAVGGKLS
jgi:outer membrane protein TolC